MVMRRPERKKQQPGSYYNPFVPPNLPTYPAQPMPAVPSARMPQLSPQPAVPSVPMPQFGQRGAAAPPPAPAAKLPVPKKMNTETNAQYQARLQRLGANRLLNPPAAPPVPSTGGLQKLNTESNAQFEARKLRHADGYTPPPSRANLNPTNPSDAMQPGFADLERQMEAGTLPFQVDQQRRMDEYAQRTAATPQRPQVDESLLSRLPSRSERDRATMQPGGMGFTEPVEDDGYTFKGSGATPGTRFDAGMFRNRQDQIDFLDKRVADHMAQADENGVVTTQSGATSIIDSDPSSPTYGKKTVTGIPPRERTSEERQEMEARKAARRQGSVYTDSDGNVTDYGQLNKNREEYRARQAERKEQARELRMRRAQLMNYGQTGGAIVDPSGGIAGPMHVGFQPRFGPNMSLNQATLMAQRQLDKEDLLQDAMKRADEKDRMSGLKELAMSGDRQAGAAYRREFGVEEDSVRTEIDDAIASGAIPTAPKLIMRIEATPVKDREQMLFQIERIIDSGAISRDAKILMLEEMYGKLTPEKIDAFQNGTSYDKAGPGSYELTKKLMEFLGLTPEPGRPTQQGAPPKQDNSQPHGKKTPKRFGR